MPYQLLAATDKFPAGLQKMYSALLEELDELQKFDLLPPDKAEKGVAVCHRSMLKIRDYIDGGALGTKDEEIFFFKYVKPLFYSKLLFYEYVLLLERGRPEGGPEAEKKYFRERLTLLELYFQDHYELYAYLRKRSTHNDLQYFLRKKDDGVHMVDPRYAAPMDLAVAQVYRNELVQEYLLESLRLLDDQPAAAIQDGEIQFTGKLNMFYQLTYGLKLTGVINNGNITIMKLAQILGRFFNVDPKNIYRGWMDNSLKKDQASFLREMVQAVENNHAETNERPPRR